MIAARLRFTLSTLLFAVVAATFSAGPAWTQDAPPPPQSGSAADDAALAWHMLEKNAAPDKSAHDRIQALAALGTLGKDERAAKLIGDAIVGHNFEVRIAAILAAGLSKNPALIPALKQALDDDNPQVAYTAAVTLWNMHDYSGEDLLLAVAEGDRKAKPGLLKSSEHKASKDLHNPKKLALIGINESAGYFIGPFGVGLKAIEYADKNSGAGPRAAAVDTIAQQHTEAVRSALIADLTDPEPAIRAAAAKGLGNWPGPESARELYPLFGDTHLAVRLTAAASYLKVLQSAPEPPNNSAAAQ